MEGKKLSQLQDKLSEIKGTERIYVSDGGKSRYLLIEQMATRKNLESIKPLTINGDVTNNPDNEDLSSTIDPESQKGVIRFADKRHDAASFSGLGRVYLRKNISPTRTGEQKNILTQEMINQPNTIYHIQYDYDLDGQTINVPTNCILCFEGGSFKNGVINGNGTRVIAPKTLIFNNVAIKGTYISKFYFEWIYKVNMNPKNIILANNLIFVFGNTTYQIKTDGWVTPSSTVLLGNGTILSITADESNGTKFQITFRPKCQIYGIDFKLQNEINNEFVRLVDTIYSGIGGGASDYGLHIDRVSFSGPWVDDSDGSQAKLKGTGVSILVRDYDDDNNFVDNIQNLVFLDKIDTLKIKYFDVGLMIKIHKKYPDRNPVTMWANALQFRNLEIWAGIGVKLLTNKIIESGSLKDIKMEFKQILFDTLTFQYCHKQDIQTVFWGHCDTLLLNNISSWDGNSIGKLSGKVIVGLMFRERWNPYYKDFGIKALEGYNVEVLSSIDHQVDNIKFALKAQDSKGNATTGTLSFNVDYGGMRYNVTNRNSTEKSLSNVSFSLYEADKWGEVDKELKNSVWVTSEDGKKVTKYFDTVYPLSFVDNTGNKILPYLNIYNHLGTKTKYPFFPIFVETLSKDIVKEYGRGAIYFDNATENFYISDRYLDPMNIADGSRFIHKNVGTKSYRDTIDSKQGYGLVKIWDDGLKKPFYGYKNVEGQLVFYDSNGVQDGVKFSGAFWQKPTTEQGIQIGFSYFCTDKQTTEGAKNGIMIYHQGNDVWVDALGRIVS